MPASGRDLFSAAVDLAARIRAGDLLPVDLMPVTLARTERP
jgi:hypothetical protein